jgi:hypothetical protein
VKAASLRRDGMWSSGPSDQADALVPERGQVVEGLAGGGHVVGGDAREVEVLDRRVDQHHRDAPVCSSR